ncbi:MAG: DMSO/selenate family reductase complex B subunit [Saezia sp.]
MNKQYGFMIDATRCTGCKTCQLACKDYKDLDVGRNFRRVYEYAGGGWKSENGSWEQNVFAYYTSIACNHCEDPACVKVCPTGAHAKQENGLVTIDESKCIGCKQCAMACPYGAPQFNEANNKMTKCNACEERLSQGLKPICVEACPLRALDFAPIENLRKQYGDLAEVAPLPPAVMTKPNLVIKPNRLSRPAGDKEGFLGNPSEV